MVVPKLRFKKFNGEWKIVKLGEISNLSSSKRIHLSDYVKSGIPFYRGSEISNGGITGNQELFISRELYEEIKKKYGVPDINDLLVSAVGTIGNFWKVDNREFYYKDGNLILISALTIDVDYVLSYFADGLGKKRILDSAAGSNQKALTMVKMRELKIPLPSREEQKRIGEFFSLYNKKIQMQQEKIDLLKEQKKGFMQKIFSQELRFKDADGQAFPEWEKKLIGEIGDVIMGQSPDGSSYSEDSSDTVLVQGNADLKHGKIVPRIYTSQITKMATIGDIILTVRAPVGVVAKCNIPACIGRGVCVIRSDDFLFYYLDYYYITSQWTKLSQGSTFESVNSNDIKNIIVPQPSSQEKEEIISFFDRLTQKIHLAEAALSELEKQKQAFMQQMFI